MPFPDRPRSRGLARCSPPMPPPPDHDLLPKLRAAGLLAGSENADLVPLSGGVSSDILLVRPATSRAFVVKRALPKLKVKDDWFADPARNRAEQDWFSYVARLLPASVPQLWHRDTDWFAMEFLEGDLTLWKSELLAGRAHGPHAAAAGAFLGTVHRASWDDPVARATFATGRNFYELRISPYLVTAGERLPALRSHFLAEAERLGATELALVHGDYSPKNLMVGPNRFVVLDAEVAWFGDPAFDLSFLLTHLHLKALHRPDQADALLALVPAFWTGYCVALGPRADAAIEARTVRLLMLLMLARVHGKSPVEYLTADRQAIVTRALSPHVPVPPATLARFTAEWKAAIPFA